MYISHYSTVPTDPQRTGRHGRHFGNYYIIVLWGAPTAFPINTLVVSSAARTVASSNKNYELKKKVTLHFLNSNE